MITFEGWPKTPRLSNGGVTITEKIDGTNACIVVLPMDQEQVTGVNPTDLGGFAWVYDGDRQDIQYLVGAQSRNRLIFPGKDNAGFAGWIQDHASELVDILGPGRHFGEWWGSGIQRRYDMDRKVFSLFNTHKWQSIANKRDGWWTKAGAINLDVVPVLYEGRLSDKGIEGSLDLLRDLGSIASAKYGRVFKKPEGVIIRMPGGQVFKAFVENDDVPKSVSENHREDNA